MINAFSAAVKFLEKYIPLPSKKHPGKLGFARMKYLCDLLGNPQFVYPTIHVGGTAGKGSTATIIASILATKYKVGLHTSPHLVKINERIKVFSRGPLEKGNDISDKDFIDLINFIKPFVEKMEKSKFGPPSYFEIVTVMAFLHFEKQKVDFAVIEVGLGGRYDATNVVTPLVSVITSVGLDHTEILGNTVEKIAKDKAGIIKSKIEVVTGAKQKSVIDIISAKCKAQNARLSLLWQPDTPGVSIGHFSYRIKKLDSEGSVFDYRGFKSLKNLKIKLLGEFQIQNAALAIRTIEVLVSRGPLIKEEEIKQGLLNAYIPGRLEIISRKPLVVLDGAHNPDKVKALVASIKKIFPGKQISSIIAIKNDKKAEEMLKILIDLSKKVILTRFELKTDQGVIRSYDPETLLNIVKSMDSDRPLLMIDDAKKALLSTIGTAKQNDLILVTGSLYLVGELKRVVSS